MGEERKVCLGLLKHVPEKWNLDENMNSFEVHARNAAQRGVKLFTTCECYLDGYCVVEKNLDKDRFASIAQGTDSSPYTRRVRRLAAETRMHIIFGFSWKSGKGIRNAALFVDDEGKDIGIYCKTHLYAHDLNYVHGDDLTVFDTKLGRIGIMICADRRWPEVARTLKLKGAEIIINPTYGMCHYANEWWMRTRAYENEVYIAFAHPSVSFICGPDGEVEAKLLSNVPDVLVHNVDLSRKINEMMPYRRPELYGAVTEKEMEDKM